jgi:hypothetical protein
MVAVIKTGHSIHHILNYNENKVKEGAAECISAANYPMDVEQLSIKNKLNRMLKQASLNENVTRNSVHVSLNFDPSEKISNAQLKEIAETYMQKTGFSEQPYLVYQHFDAGHPHIHIVTVKVRADGSRIDMQNIGRNQSEKARKEIEIAYGLVKAGTMKMKQYELKSAHTSKVQYGKSDSRRAVTNVLDAVLTTYKYTSLPELNAVLKQYNVLADRGRESSRVYQHHGLLYRILDENGNSIGVPIKASSFYNKPTLKYLEERFHLNEAARQPHKARVKNAIDMVLLNSPKQSLQSLIKALQKEGIKVVLRQNTDRITYGITYVDHHTKCVFNGSSLGKAYSAKGIQERCIQHISADENVGSKAIEKEQLLRGQHCPKLPSQLSLSKEHKVTEQISPVLTIGKTLDTLMQPEYKQNYLPYQLKKKNKKKKRKRISGNQ